MASLLISRTGYAGLIAQTGLATDESGKELFESLFTRGHLKRFLDFENRGEFFPDVHPQMRFSLVTIRGSKPVAGKVCAEFGWLLHNINELTQPERIVTLFTEDLFLFNPSSRTCPAFSSSRDFSVSKIIYQHGHHVYIDDTNRFGNIDFLGELFNMTRDSGYFQNEPTESVFPLYEAKFLHQFDHRFATVFNGEVMEFKSEAKQSPDIFVTPKSYVDTSIVYSRTSKRNMHRRWMAGFRSIASPTNEHTSIFAVIPFGGVGNSINLVLGLSAYETAILMANANSFVFDFCARQKISGSNVNIWIFKQLPTVPLERYSWTTPWSDDQLLWNWMLPRILELTYTAWDLKLFAEDCKLDGPPFIWNEERRFLIRGELDAAYCHLYGITHDDVDHIMETFPILKRKEEAQYGEYRTKRMILKVFDAMSEAIRTGIPYQTILDPPPGPPVDANGEMVPVEQWNPANWPCHIHRSTELPISITVPSAPYLEDPQVFPWNGRETFVHECIPQLVALRSGRIYEYYVDAAILASRPERLHALLSSESQGRLASLRRDGLDADAFPETQRIRPFDMREDLTDVDTGCLVVDPDGVTTLANPAAGTAMDNSRQQLLSLALEAADKLHPAAPVIQPDLVTEQEADEIRAFLARVMTGDAEGVHR